MKGRGQECYEQLSPGKGTIAGLGTAKACRKSAQLMDPHVDKARYPRHCISPVYFCIHTQRDASVSAMLVFATMLSAWHKPGAHCDSGIHFWSSLCAAFAGGNTAQPIAMTPVSEGGKSHGAQTVAVAPPAAAHKSSDELIFLISDRYA